MPSRLLVLFWNPTERRLRAGWRIAVAHLAVLLPAFGMAWLARLVTDPVGRTFARAMGADVRAESALSFAVLQVLRCLVTVVALGLVSRFVDRRSLVGLGLRIDRRFGAEAAFGAILGAVLMSAILGVEMSFGWARYEGAPPIGELSRAAYLPVVVLAFLAVAIDEELLFRGNQLKNLAEGLASRWIPPRFAAVAAVSFSSLTFGLAHAGNPSATLASTVNIVMAGGMLAAGYLVTGRLAIAIGLHFSWNFFQNLYGMPVSGLTYFSAGSLLVREELGPDWITGGPFGPEAGMTGLVAMVTGTVLTLAWVRFRRGALRIEPSIAAPPPLPRAREGGPA